MIDLHTGRRRRFWILWGAAVLMLAVGLLLTCTGATGAAAPAASCAAMLLFAASFCVAEGNAAYAVLVAVMLAFGLFFALTGDIFSPVDEAAHYYNVHYLLAAGRLPNMNIDPAYYESVHPPLYTQLAALLCLPFGSRVARVVLLRCFGLVLWALCALLTVRALRELQEKQLLADDHGRNLTLLLLLWGCPGVMVRFATISNEGLSVFFSTGALLGMLRLLTGELNGRRLACVTSLVALACLTKITALFLLAPLLFVLWAKQRLPLFAVPVAGVLAALAPWFAWNWHLYGALTGTARHLEYVIPLVNPEQRFVNPLRTLPMLLTSWFFPDEARAAGWVSILLLAAAAAAVLCLLMVLAAGLVFGIRFLRGRLELAAHPRENIFLFAAIAVAGNLAVPIYGTLSTRVNVMNGRYLYHMTLALALLAALVWDRREKLFSLLQFPLALFPMALGINTLQQFAISWLNRL